MPVEPLVQFRAGMCEVDDASKPWKIRPKSALGFIYLYREEDLTHFCWRSRNSPLDDLGPDALDLIMLPGDGSFEPWQSNETGSSGQTQQINGRIYRLGFQSSSTKHFFWLQSKEHDSDRKPGHWSQSDKTLGKIVSEILNGEDVNAKELYRQAKTRTRSSGHGGDTDMQDVGDDEDDDDDDDDDDDERTGSSGTGGNGDEPRQGGESGARATHGEHVQDLQHSEADAQTAVADLLRSLQGNTKLSGLTSANSFHNKLYTTLPELLKPDSTIEAIIHAEPPIVDRLLSELPAQLLLTEVNNTDLAPPSSQAFENSTKLMRIEQKRKILIRVLRSPQFTQSLASLTAALRDGGLPTIGEALHVSVTNGGYIKQGRVPLGGGEAVEAFLKAIKDKVEKGLRSETSDQMDED